MHDHIPGSFFSDRTDPKPNKSYTAATLFGVTLLGVFMWAALCGASVDTTSHLRHQEAFSGFRTASTEQVR